MSLNNALYESTIVRKTHYGNVNMSNGNKSVTDKVVDCFTKSFTKQDIEMLTKFILNEEFSRTETKNIPIFIGKIEDFLIDLAPILYEMELFTKENNLTIDLSIVTFEMANKMQLYSCILNIIVLFGNMIDQLEKM